VRRAVAAVLGVVVLAAPAAARAFCRTTTVHEPVPYDPVASGCWTNGAPLAWAGEQRIPYAISKAASNQMSLDDATRIAHQSFDTWNNASCNGQPPNVQVYDDGPVSVDAAATDCGLNSCDPTVHDMLHLVVFDDVTWPHNDPNNTLALTTVTYGIDSGEIFDADIEVNTAQHKITAQEPPPTGTFALHAILTHEAGHFFGLAHATTTAPIMYAQYQPDAINLTQDDIEGVCAIYPPQNKAGCACDVARGGQGAWAIAAVAGLAVLTAARRRRRAGPRPAPAPRPPRRVPCRSTSRPATGWSRRPE
jgi:MYXO-CTERM domain-containing protein